MDEYKLIACEVSEMMISELNMKLQRKLKYMSWRKARENYKKKESIQGNGKTLSHVTYYSVGNAGDTVLSQCVRKCFSQSDNSCSWNIIEVNKRVTSKTTKSINETVALIIGGGGLFLPDTNKNTISGWQWAISRKQLDEITVPLIIFSVGYNYFRGQVASELFVENLIALCEKASFIGLRNKGSVNAVRDLLPSELKEKVVYQPCTTTIIRQLYGNSLSEKKPSKVVAFNLAFDRSERRYGEDKTLICAEIAKAAKSIEVMGYEIVVVCHCFSDAEICHYMDEEHVNYTIKDLTLSFPDEVLDFYNEVDCALGMRGHAQMIPFGMNCNIISLGTHDKMKWFLEDIESVDWYVDLNENVLTLKDRILVAFKNAMIYNREENQIRLISAQERLWNITKGNMDLIQEIINNAGGGIR